MKDDDFKMLRSFVQEQTDRINDICECRVAFVIENSKYRCHFYWLKLTIEYSEDSLDGERKGRDELNLKYPSHLIS